jgi:hypothetical protein
MVQCGREEPRFVPFSSPPPWSGVGKMWRVANSNPYSPAHEKYELTLIIPYTTTDPHLQGGSNFVDHDLIITWDCCPKKMKTHVVYDYIGPK